MLHVPWSFRALTKEYRPDRSCGWSAKNKFGYRIRFQLPFRIFVASHFGLPFKNVTTNYSIIGFPLLLLLSLSSSSCRASVMCSHVHLHWINDCIWHHVCRSWMSRRKENKVRKWLENRVVTMTWQSEMIWCTANTLCVMMRKRKNVLGSNDSLPPTNPRAQTSSENIRRKHANEKTARFQISNE